MEEASSQEKTESKWVESRVGLLLPNFLAFSFVYPAQALLNSTPQLLARDRRAVAQGLFRGAKFLVSGF